MTILFRPQGAFGWFSYTTSRDTILQAVMSSVWMGAVLGSGKLEEEEGSLVYELGALEPRSCW